MRELTIRDKAKIETMEFVANKLKEEDAPAVVAMTINMQTLMVIHLYEDKIKELSNGGTTKLLEALAKGNFTDENGVSLTDTITFKQLQEQVD